MSRDSKGLSTSVSCFSWFSGKHGDARRREIPARAAAEERRLMAGMMQDIKRDSQPQTDSMSVVATLGYHPPSEKKDQTAKLAAASEQEQRLPIQGYRGDGTPKQSGGPTPATAGTQSNGQVHQPSPKALSLPTADGRAPTTPRKSPKKSKSKQLGLPRPASRSSIVGVDELDIEYMQDIPIEVVDDELEVFQSPELAASAKHTSSSLENGDQHPVVQATTSDSAAVMPQGISPMHEQLALQDADQNSPAARDIHADLRDKGNEDLVNWIAPILADDPTVVLTLPSKIPGKDQQAEQVRLMFNDRALRSSQSQPPQDVTSPMSRISPSSGASGGSSTGYSKEGGKSKEQRAIEQAISAAPTPSMSGQSVHSGQSGRSQQSVNSSNSPITSTHEPVPQLQQEDNSDGEDEGADFEMQSSAQSDNKSNTLRSTQEMSRTTSTERPQGSLINRIEADLQKLGDSDDNGSDDEMINVNDSRFFRDSTGRRGLLC